MAEEEEEEEEGLGGAFTLQVGAAHHVGMRDCAGLQDPGLRDAGGEHLLGCPEMDGYGGMEERERERKNFISIIVFRVRQPLRLSNNLYQKASSPASLPLTF